VKVTGVASSDALIDQVRERFGKKFKREIVDANVEAIKRAVAEVREG
jgi:Pyruvate/2-oxoacid:ferredoxin oxidoreductase gamma subunit